MTRRRSLARLAAIAALAVACQPGATPASPSGSAIGSVPVGSTASPPRATARASDGTGASAAPTFAGTPFPPRLTATVDLGPGPILSPNNGPEGHVWVLPAAGARAADGTFVLFVVWFGMAPGDQIVTVATSEDARSWDVDHDPVFTDLGAGFADPGPIPSAVRQLDDGSWVMFGWAARTPNPNEIFSWRASAPEPAGPWSLDEPEVLAKGAAEAWDSQSASIGSIDRDGDTWRAWYEGQPPGSEVRGRIGLATSGDGSDWTKHPEPAIDTGICGPGTGVAVQQPQVERLGDGFAALFGGFRAARAGMEVYGAVSVDGERWECAALDPLVTEADLPGSTGIHTISSIRLDDDTIALLIESITTERSEVWLATVEAAS